MLKRTTIILLCCAALSSCATIGRPFALESIATLYPGQTTKTEVETMFGKPWRKGLENGLETWTYAHYHYSAFHPLESDDLLIKFEKSGLVKSYTFNTSRDVLIPPRK